MWERVRILWGLMVGRRLLYGASIAAMVVAAALAYVQPLIGRWAIDHVIAGRALEAPRFIHSLIAMLGGRDVLVHNLWVAGLAILAITAVSGLMTYLRGRWSAAASESIARSLRDRLYDHIQRLPCIYHDKTDAGELIQRCGSDVETIRTFLASGVTEVGRAGVLLILGVPVMLYVSPVMTAVAMGVLPVIFAYSVVFFVKVRANFKRSDEAEARMTTALEENLAGIRVVRAFGRGAHECRKFAGHNAEYRDLWRRLIRLLAWFWSLSDGMCMCQVGAVLLVGSYRVLAGRLTVGELFAFVSFVHTFMWPIRYMGRILADFGQASVSLDRVHEVLRQPREDQDEGGELAAAAALAVAAPPAGTSRFAGELVVEGLSFRHGESLPVLSGVSFHLPAGQTLAVLGPSGSGKSTLVNLLLRLYDYQDGSIRLDGRELSAMDRASARRQFGVVLQEPFLYSKTVRDNIRLGWSRATDERVAEAAQAACIHEAILGFQQGYDTLVGERGVTLSGGQRQRVALARAMLADPPILILDDALSAVDAQTEAMILEALRTRHGRRSTLLIAHRLSTLRQADQIIVLAGGRIVQSGTHDDLVRRDGLYRRLWQIQTDLAEDLRRDSSGPAAPAERAAGGGEAG